MEMIKKDILKSMIRQYFALITLIVLFSHKAQSQTISGELYIKTIDVQDLFDDLTNEQIKQTKQLIENPNLANEYSDVEKKLFHLFNFLYDNELLRKPHFKLKLGANEIINVYTSRAEYEKLACKLTGLDIYDQKIDIAFIGKKISDGFFESPIYYCDEFVLIEKLYR